MNKILGRALSYNDVQIIPTISSINSRLDVDLTSSLDRDGKIVLSIPIMSAAMDTITETEMAIHMAKLGGIGIIHRFQTVKDRINQASAVRTEGLHVGSSIGLDDSLKDIAHLAEHSSVLNLDIAHAHHERVLDFVKKIKDKIPSVVLMVGNIATYAAAVDFLKTKCVDILKQGIGGGSSCSTRVVTGVGVSNITSILQIKDAIRTYGPETRLVADGGISGSAEAAKALGAGANFVMIGGALAGVLETPGPVVDGKKMFRGMASKAAQSCWKGGLKPGTVPEGVSVAVPAKGRACDVVEGIVGGLRSAFTYVGAKDMKSFYDRVEFYEVTQAGQVEATPHILNRL